MALNKDPASHYMYRDSTQFSREHGILTRHATTESKLITTTCNRMSHKVARLQKYTQEHSAQKEE